MDYKHIHTLLESYWEGTSSVEDERELKAFFSATPIPEELKMYQAYFAYLEATGNISLKKELPNRDRSLSLHSPSKAFYKRPFWQAIGVAASLVFVFGIFFLLQSPHPQTEERQKPIAKLLPKDTFENPEEAYQAAREALLIFSGKMKTGKTMIFKPKAPSTIEEYEK